MVFFYFKKFINGHLIAFEILIKSFTVIQIANYPQFNDILWNIISFSAWMFKGAVIIAIPAIISLLVICFHFGIISAIGLTAIVSDTDLLHCWE